MYKKEVLKEAHKLMIKIEKYDLGWLKSEAKKRKLSIAGLIRHWIKNFRK